MKDNGLLLCLDTSTPVGSIALTGEKGVIAAQTSANQASHTEKLFSLITGLLNGCGHSLDQVEGLALASGPGSFTGLRIAAATAKTLAWSLGKPLYAVGTLESLAWGAHASGIPVLALLDAGQNEFYAAAYLWEDYAAGGHELLAPCALSPDSLAAAVERLVPEGRLTCAGQGVSSAWESLCKANGVRLTRPAARLGLPDASFLSELVRADSSARLVRDIFSFEPQYVRSGQVQLRLGK